MHCVEDLKFLSLFTMTVDGICVFLSTGENTEHVNTCEKLEAHFYTM